MADHTINYNSRLGIKVFDVRTVAQGSDDGTDPTAGTTYPIADAKFLNVVVDPDSNLTGYSYALYLKIAGAWKELVSAGLTSQTTQIDKVYELRGMAQSAYIRIYSTAGSDNANVYVTADWR